MYSKLFTQLFVMTTITLILFFIVIGLFIFSDNLILYQKILILILNLFIVVFSLILIGVVMIVFSKPNKKNHPLILKWMDLSFSVLYPFIYMTGRLVGIKKDRIRREFANINNYLVNKKRIKVKANEILILIPHCIQLASCPHKITNDINNCKLCGKCKVKDLIELSKKYGAHLAIATGGTLARKIIIEKNPKAIIAVACERDLSSGIQDVKVIPVLGVLNERPEGPCYNTTVDMSKIEENILYYLNGGEK